MQKFIYLIACTFLFLGCQKSEKDALQSAQLCLNNATPENARSCVDKISDLYSPNAQKLKCSAIYLAEGFGTASQIITLLDSLDSNAGSQCNTGNCSPTLAVITELSFKNGDNSIIANRDKNLSLAEEAMATCSNTGFKSYVQISSLFKIGTMAAMQAYTLRDLVPPLNPNDPISIDEVKDAVADLPPQELGKIAYDAYHMVCAGNISPTSSTQDYCNELNKAMSNYGDNYNSIGQCLIQILQDSQATCI